MGVYPVDFPSAWKRRGGGEPARTEQASPALPGRAAAAAPSAGGTCCLNCSNPKLSKPPAGGAPARRLKAAATGEAALHDLPPFIFSIGSEDHQGLNP